MKAAIMVNPVGIAVNANDDFMSYTNGIFMCNAIKCPQDASSLNHAVLLVGYGTYNNSEYFLLKNSWGTTWGEDGFMRIQNTQTGLGTSGMFN